MAQDHFERHNHHEGVVDWNFNLILNDQPFVAGVASAYRPVLERADLYEPIPNEWLHATVLRVGLEQDYSEEEMLAVAERVQELLRLQTFPRCHFAQRLSMFGTIFLMIEPEKELQPLYKSIRQALTEIVGPTRATASPHGRFIPHMSLVYSRKHDNDEEVEAALDSVHVPAGEFNVTHMALIRQRPIDGHYEWDIVKDIELS